MAGPAKAGDSGGTGIEAFSCAGPGIRDEDVGLALQEREDGVGE